jgi:hypothetical protein
MRRFLILLTLSASNAAFAQTPPRLEPLPVPPPPPPGLRDADPAERGVRIPTSGDDLVEPVYDAGRVTRYKVTPPGGTPYFLIDTTGNGTWMRRDSLDSGTSAPLWQVLTFD